MPGYVYRGTDHYVGGALPVTGLPPLNPALCGTNAGYHQHHRRREEKCEPCKQAHRDYDTAYRVRRKAAGLTRKTASRKAEAA
ncbi:hypothetical protein PV761_03370 [Arthrobacter sp. CC3]|uniref:hypothetical protein n=1 Tax=Arthrobacter sp. CC3 TaxID=3029185 RepID=UPI003267EEB1